MLDACGAYMTHSSVVDAWYGKLRSTLQSTIASLISLQRWNSGYL